jgi:hypothetical protein
MRSVPAPEARMACESLPGGSCSGEVLQAVRGPRVLHIATHGFFESYSEGVIEFLMKGRSPIFQKDPMLRSGRDQ